MALRGHGYREILAHYYGGGVELGRVVTRASQRQGAEAPGH
jgi:hypothetical protein